MVTTREVEAKLRAALAGRSDIFVAILFGSFARGASHEASDVDLAVLPKGIDRLTLAAELSALLSREVDVVSLDDPGVPLLGAVVREGVVVHEGRTGAAAQWRSRALIDLETDRPWFRRMRDAW